MSLVQYKPRTVALVQPKKGNTSSTNLVYKNKKRQNKKKAVVARSFRTAYNKMRPSKEQRFVVLANMKTDLLADWVKAYNLDVIGQGSQSNDRIGNNVHLSYIHMRGTIQNNSVVKAKFIRMMIVADTNNDGVVINTGTFANLYKDYLWTVRAPTGGETDGRYVINTELCKVYYDHTWKIPMESEGIVSIRKNFRINRKLLYSTNSAVTTPQNGRLYLILNLFDGDSAPVATLVDTNFMIRIFFKDGNKMK